MSTDLSKLLVLETALEHLLKVNPQEELEYVDNASQLPKDTPLVRTKRGAIGYYPSQIGKKSEATEQGVSVDRPELEPEKAREISGVTADSLPSEAEDEPESEATDEWTFFPERSSLETAIQANEYFDEVSLYLDWYLQQAKGSDFKSYLGKAVDPNKLSIDNAKKAGYTDGSKEGSGEPTGLGINSMSNWTVTIEDQPFIYKLVKGENQGEILSYSLDRALGLNIVPYTKSHSIDIDVLKSLIERTQNVDEAIEDFYMEEHAREGRGAKAGGHFQEFCTNCLGREERTIAMSEMLTTEEGREEFLKVILLDFLTGNDDRHTGNYLITKDKKIVAIDNGFAGHAQQMLPHQDKKSVDLLGTDYLGGKILANIEGMSFPYGVARSLLDNVGSAKVSQISNRDSLTREAGKMFDKYFNPANTKILNKALQMSMWQFTVGKDKDADFVVLKDKFAEHASRNLQMGIIGQGTGTMEPLVPTEEGLDTPDFDWGKEYSLETPAVESTPNIYEEDEFN